MMSFRTLSLYCGLFWTILVGVFSKAQNSELQATNTFINASFPSDFLIGAATASYQVEGGWNADGKGESMWDRMAHTRPELFRKKSTGDVACDSYHHFKEDVALLKDVGFQVYRFSISWTRILPNGEITKVNQAGVNYYHALIDELLKYGIQPMVTMYHWDLPQRLQDMGGWLNPLIVDFVEDYADLLFQLYGEKVKLWITINEPVSIMSGYSFYIHANAIYAPGLPLDSPANYIAAYNVLLAHARVYRLYNKRFRAVQHGKVAIVLASPFFKENTTAKEDIEATERAWAFSVEIYAHPIYSKQGDFPDIVKKIVAEHSKQEGRQRSRLPQFTREEIELLKGSSDFLGLNYYSTGLISARQTSNTTLFEKDQGFTFKADPKWPRNHLNWTVVPWGIREMLRFVKDRYNNPPMFITENGYCDKPRVLDDVDRVNYFRDHLREVLKAKEQFGCNVIGYIAWSLLDNLEWNEGYEWVTSSQPQKNTISGWAARLSPEDQSNAMLRFPFGIHHVDFADPARKRTAKLSAKFFKQLLKTRIIPT